ncbi:TMV resistance protein N-like [Pyrus ussuriensis x Pyrus communis]|uniref:TMV resistance protein N-like n=1 Tax=Pyrus ussuriensis x Pyrus communis TaxID=2448454 RepID=A0A5N5HE97_9ROSA|nr:TMV resistance protein N-like [Pyrus ussuriensis x Pyrus communis]
MDAIGTLLYMCCRSFSSSSPAADSTDVPGVEVTDIASSSSAAAPADANDTKKYDVFISFRDELVHILKCKERYGQMVIPVFYDINPSDVRKQHGSYADAFAQLEKRFDNNIYKVHKWREALTTAANLSGIDYSNKPRTEADLIKNVVHRICTKLIGESSCNLEGLFGIESHIEQIEELENSEKPNGLDHLVKTLLKEILKEENLSMESTFVQDRLRRTKVLIVLDDVSNSMQMQHLAGNRLRYGSGSRIIITSRDRSTLRQIVEVDKIYEVEGLQPDDVVQLFCLCAFKDNSTRRTYYKELVEKAVHYAGRVPLALIVLGPCSSITRAKKNGKRDSTN